MSQKRGLLIIFIMLMSMIISACGGGETAGNGGPILTWITNGISMTNISTPERGILATMNDKGETGEIFAIPNNTTRVIACGEQATSPNRRFFAFYIGGITGKLYVMDGGAPPKEYDTTAPLTCLGMGTLQYSPDSNRIGYITFAGNAVDRKMPTGTYIQRETGNGNEQFRYDNVAAFDLNNNTTALVAIIADNNGQFKEAVVFRYTGGNTPEEITPIFADDGCQFRSARVTFASDNRLALLMGQECRNNSTWKFYTLDISNKIAAVALSGTTGGQFFSDSAQTILIASPNGENVVFTVQDGIAIESTNLYMVNMNSIQQSDPLVRYAIMPRQPFNRPYDFTNAATPVISSDGRWLGVVSRTPNNSYSVHVLDLNSPNGSLINISGGIQGDVISAIQFSPNNQRLFYIAGGHSGNNNSLFYIDINSALETRVIRGRYTGNIVISPDGNSIALLDWQVIDAPRQPNILHLSLINVGNGQSTQLYSGGTFADNVVTGSRFAYPLWWR
jgi:hypothetical protein